MAEISFFTFRMKLGILSLSSAIPSPILRSRMNFTGNWKFKHDINSQVINNPTD